MENAAALLKSTIQRDKSSFCSWNPHKVAFQLTAKYAINFCNIKDFELKEFALDKLSDQSAIKSIIQLNKSLECKIPSSFLNDGNAARPKQFAEVVEFWIDVACELYQLNNFECLQIVVHSLNSPLYDANRLKKFWNKVDRTKVHKLQELIDVVSFDDNYAKLRQLLRDREAASEKSKSSPRMKHKHHSFKGYIPCLNIVKKDLLGAKASSDLCRNIKTGGPQQECLDQSLEFENEKMQILRAQSSLLAWLQMGDRVDEKFWAWLNEIQDLSQSQRDSACRKMTS